MKFLPLLWLALAGCSSVTVQAPSPPQFHAQWHASPGATGYTLHVLPPHGPAIALYTATTNVLLSPWTNGVVIFVTATNAVSGAVSLPSQSLTNSP